jgi:hypothetical protein
MAAAYNPGMSEDDSIDRAIAGALRATIRDHGPITPEHIGSAVKRIRGNLQNARLDVLAAELGRRRWAGMSEEEQREHQSAAGKASWKGTTKAERSAEMSRRRKKGLKTDANEKE